MGRGHEGLGGNDHVAGQPQGPHRDLQAQGGVGHGHRVANLAELGQFLLEPLQVHAVVAVPGPVQDVVDARLQATAVAQVGLADVQG